MIIMRVVEKIANARKCEQVRKCVGHKGRCTAGRRSPFSLEKGAVFTHFKPGLSGPPQRDRIGPIRQMSALFCSRHVHTFLGDFDPGESDSRSLGQT